MANRFLSNITINDSYTFPSADGANGQVIGTDGAGNLSFVDQTTEALTLNVTVKNKSGGSLAKGTIVHAHPSANPPSGNVVEVIAADYDTSTSMPAIGVLNETLANEAEGQAIMFGAVSGIDTSSFSAGDELWVGNNGAFTNTKPATAGQLIQKIAVVIKSHASNGLIKIFGAGRTNDVPLPLYIDNTNQRVGIGTATPAAKLDVSGDIYVRNGAALYTDVLAGFTSGVITLNSNTNFIVPLGSIGIGTTSPSQKLDVVGNAEINGILYVNKSSENTRFNSTDANGPFVSFRNNGTAKGYIGSGYHLWSSPNNISDNFGIRAENQLDFGIGASVKMTVNSSGDVNIYNGDLIVQSGALKGPSTFYIDPSPDDTGQPGGATTDTGTVVILGDLQVTGTTTTIDSTTLNVGDLNIVLAKDATTAAAANGAGITINGANATMTYNSTDDRFEFNKAIRSSSHVLAGSNVYSGDASSFRNYGGVWKATTGLTGNGFQFVSADGTAMTISSTGFVDINNGLLVNGGGSNFDTIRIEAPNASVYFKDTTSGVGAWHIGHNDSFLYVLEDTDGNGVYNNINARWDTGGYEQYTGNIDNRVGSYQIAGVNVIDSSRNLSVAYGTFSSNISVNNTITTPTNTNLALMPNGTGNVYFGNSTNGNIIYHYSRLNDGIYTIFDHTSTQTRFNTTASSGFLFDQNTLFSGTLSNNGYHTITSTSNEHLKLAYNANYDWRIYREGSPSTGDLVFATNQNGTVSERLRLEVSNSIATFAGEVRGVAFRDTNNTNRVLDPSGTSTIDTLNTVGNLTILPDSGASFRHFNQTNTNRRLTINQNSGSYPRIYNYDGVSGTFHEIIIGGANDEVSGLYVGGSGDINMYNTVNFLSSNANLTISGDTAGNIYYSNSAGEHRWRANGSSVNSMTLSSSQLTVNENTVISGTLEADSSFKLDDVHVLGTGAIGLNRDTSNGNIYNSNYSAFQLQHNRGVDVFELQAYNSAGTFQDRFVFTNTGNFGIGTFTPGLKLTVNGAMSAHLFYDYNDTSYFVNPNSTTTSANFAGKVQASQVGVTNIVTNKVVKFNGSILDDSIITDDGTFIDVAGKVQADNAFIVQGVDTSNSLPSADHAVLSGYGLIGNRGTFYITNPYTVQIGTGVSHNNDPAALFTSSSITLKKETTVENFLTISRGADKKIRFSDTRTGANTFSIEHDASQIYLYNETTASSLLEIENNGYIGVGVSPIYKFDVNGTLGVRSGTIQTNGSTTSFNFLAGASAKGAKVGFLLASNSYSTTPASGVIEAQTSVNAPIFYDSDNTSYYVNPASNSVLAGNLTVGTVLNVYSDSNLGNSNDDDTTLAGRLLNTYTGTSAHQLQNATTNGTVLQLTSTADSRVLNLQTDHVYSNGNLYIGDNSYQTLLRGSYFYFENAPAVFKHGDVYLGEYGNTNGGRLYIEGTTADRRSTIQCTNGNLHIDSEDGYALYLNYYEGGSSTNVVFGTGNGGVAAQVNADGSARFPIYYDYNNTSYYVDPNSTTTSANFAGSVNIPNAAAYKIDGTDILEHNTSYTQLNNPEGATCIYVGDSADRTNYYDNNTHRFRTAGGTGIYGDWNSTGLGVGTTSPSTKFHVYGDAVDNQSLGLFTNTYSSGGVFFPALKAVHTHSNHSYGIVAEFRTEAGAGTDRSAILFTNAHSASNWAVGQGVVGAVDDFAVGYRSVHPNTAPGWATGYFRISTAGDVSISNNIKSPIYYDLNNTAYYVHPDSLSHLNIVRVPGDIRGDGQQLILNAGESAAYATGQTGENVYVNAENGLQVNSSPDNWGTGWAGRYTATICDAAGNSYFPGRVQASEIYTAGKVIHTGDTDTYTEFNAADTWRVVVGGSQKLVVNSSSVSVSNATLSHQGLTPTSGTNIDQIYEVGMSSFTLTADTWTDTGINSTDLATGTYVVQVFVSDHNAGGGHYSEYYSGTMSWYAANTNSTNVDEIVLHNAGHASNASHLQLRTQRHAGGGDDLMLQVKQNFTHSTALDGTSGKQMVFKFRRLI